MNSKSNRVARSICVCFVATLAFLALAFTLVKYQRSSTTSDSLAGFNVIFFTKTKGGYYYSYDSVLFLNLLSLLCALLSIGFAITSIAAKNKKTIVLTESISLGLAMFGMLLYMLLGLSIVTSHNGGWIVDAEYPAKTYAYIPFLTSTIVIIAYLIICKFGSGTDDNHYSRMSEMERVSLLVKYQELYARGVISAQEFASLKRELL